MAITLIKEEKQKIPKRKSKPYYILTINYMIGDADGETHETGDISADNPFLEKFCKILKKLKNPKGHWGISLECESIYANLKQRHITKDEHDFMICMMTTETQDYNVDSKKYLKTEKDEEFANDLNELCRSNTEYSFLTYEGFDLVYVDEYKKRHKTKLK